MTETRESRGSSAGPGARASVLLAALVAGLSGCDADGSAVRAIETKRVQPAGTGLERAATTAERFRFTRPAAPVAEARLLSRTPPGWTELPSSSLRLANFQVAGDERAECYLTVLGGGGGGLLPNVNRWRQQMSLPDISAEELASLPRAPFFGMEAVLVDLRGAWTGMAGGEEAGGYRLVGLALVDGEKAKFLKMLGPEEVLEGQLEPFLALAASFYENEAPAPAGHAAEAEHAHGATLAFDAPAGWQRGPDRAMREVTFFLGAEQKTECYIAILGGTGGGAFSNVNRWRGQMGQADLSADDFAALERVPMLGTEGVIVEVVGAFEGMAGESVQDASLLGAVCELPDRALFVKMVGPAEDVQASREDFVAFCRSLKETR